MSMQHRSTIHTWFSSSSGLAVEWSHFIKAEDRGSIPHRGMPKALGFPLDQLLSPFGSGLKKRI